eukprot:4598162-Pyramimonas_sp.AAC.1
MVAAPADISAQPAQNGARARLPAGREKSVSCRRCALTVLSQCGSSEQVHQDASLMGQPCRTNAKLRGPSGRRRYAPLTMAIAPTMEFATPPPTGGAPGASHSRRRCWARSS